jgi:threonine dehydratase
MVSVRDIQQAAERIREHIIRTPLLYSPTFSQMSGASVYLKLETMQRTGSFKIRGAMNKVLLRRSEIGVEGVVAASAGNHAQGVAMAAQVAGIPVTVIMPEGASISKQEAARHYGARVILHGTTLAESLQYAKKLEGEGMMLIHPYDDPEIIAGQGTIGLEIFEDLPRTDMILVPVGGGGLISGIATATKEEHPGTSIIGVQAAACPGVYQAYSSGVREPVEPEPSIADGIIVKQAGAITLPIIRRHVDSLLLVSEEQIAKAMVLLLERKKVVAEGAGATPLAALLSGALPVQEGSKVVLVISGGNVDNPLLARIIRHELLRKGRILRISICIKDTPGQLSAVLQVIARQRANVLDIHHARGGKGLPLFAAQVDLEIETRGEEHIQEITDALKATGFPVQMR